METLPLPWAGMLVLLVPMAWLAEVANGFEAQHLRPWRYEVIEEHMSGYLHAGMGTKES